MRTSRYKRWIFYLALLLLLIEAGTMLSPDRAYDIITTILAIIVTVIMLNLLTLLLMRRHSRLFRIIVFIPVVGYLILKLWILYEILT